MCSRTAAESRPIMDRAAAILPEAAATARLAPACASEQGGATNTERKQHAFFAHFARAATAGSGHWARCTQPRRAASPRVARQPQRLEGQRRVGGGTAPMARKDSVLYGAMSEEQRVLAQGPQHHRRCCAQTAMQEHFCRTPTSLQTLFGDGGTRAGFM